MSKMLGINNIDFNKLIFETYILKKEHIFLPLYSDKGVRNVPEKSALNLWNASGRARKINEAYITIPNWIYKMYPDFFPEKDIVFHLILSNGRVVHAKVCQDGRKALMTNPNDELGKWILKEIFQLRDKEILTYEKLIDKGIDSVVICKENELSYSINVAKLESYEMFKNKSLKQL